MRRSRPDSSRTRSISCAVRRRGEADRPPRREPLHRLDRAGDQRQLVAVARRHQVDDLGGDLVRRLRQADVLVHVPRPLGRAHPHHRPLRLRAVPAAALVREALPDLVPQLLRLDQHAVQVEHDRLDHSASSSPMQAGRIRSATRAPGRAPTRRAPPPSAAGPPPLPGAPRARARAPRGGPAGRARRRERSRPGRRTRVRERVASGSEEQHRPADGAAPLLLVEAELRAREPGEHGPGPRRPATSPRCSSAGRTDTYGASRSTIQPPPAAPVAETVVQAVDPVLPELPLLGDEPVAAPGLRPLNVVAAPLGRARRPPARARRGSRRPRSAARRRRKAGSRPAASPSTRPTRRPRPARRALRPAPGDRAGASRGASAAARVLGQLAPLSAGVVREERQPALVGVLQQDHPRRRGAVARRGRQGHRLRHLDARLARFREPALELAERVRVEVAPAERPVAVVLHRPSLCCGRCALLAALALAAPPSRRRAGARVRGKVRPRDRTRRRLGDAPADAAPRRLGRPRRPEERRPGPLLRLHARRPHRRRGHDRERRHGRRHRRRRLPGDPGGLARRARLGGYKVGLARLGGDLVTTQPVYSKNDPNCCPTGGFDHTRSHWNGKRFVVARAWRSKSFHP